jgi:hypothetical protein
MCCCCQGLHQLSCLLRGVWVDHLPCCLLLLLHNLAADGLQLL